MFRNTNEVIAEEFRNGIALQLRGDGRDNFRIVYSVPGPHGHEQLVPVREGIIKGEMNASKDYWDEVEIFRKSSVH